MHWIVSNFDDVSCKWLRVGFWCWSLAGFDDCRMVMFISQLVAYLHTVFPLIDNIIVCCSLLFLRLIMISRSLHISHSVFFSRVSLSAWKANMKKKSRKEHTAGWWNCREANNTRSWISSDTHNCRSFSHQRVGCRISNLKCVKVHRIITNQLNFKDLTINFFYSLIQIHFSL